MKLNKWLAGLVFALIISAGLFYLGQDIWNVVVNSNFAITPTVSINAALSVLFLYIMALVLFHEGDYLPHYSLLCVGAFILTTALLLFRSSLMTSTVILLFILLLIFSLVVIAIVIDNIKDEGIKHGPAIVSTVIYYIILAGHIYFFPFA